MEVLDLVHEQMLRQNLAMVSIGMVLSPAHPGSANVPEEDRLTINSRIGNHELSKPQLKALTACYRAGYPEARFTTIHFTMDAEAMDVTAPGAPAPSAPPESQHSHPEPEPPALKRRRLRQPEPEPEMM